MKSLSGLLLVPLLTLPALAQSKARGKPAPAPHRWVNPIAEGRFPGVTHHTFRSASMKIDVGYCIYLPPDYATDSAGRFPVVYWLHGGNGNELTGLGAVIPQLDPAIRQKKIPPMIYVFVNGGPLWHYDDPAAGQLGETAFIKELIPHIDSTYRTIADRSARGIEGMSMGGRGSTRDIFKYPELFCSAAPLAPGIQNEQRDIDSGRHADNNVFALARKYAAHPAPPTRIFMIIGDQDQNYPSNLEYHKLLDDLKIPYTKRILPGVSHNNKQYYDLLGEATFRFHAESFKQGPGL